MRKSSRHWSIVFVCVPLTCPGPGCSREQKAPTSLAESQPTGGVFIDRTPGSGIDFSYRNGDEAGNYSILETLGGGIGLLDYDGDGLLDIFATGGGYFDGPDKRQIRGYPSKLYKNLGNWKFRDATIEAGLDQPLFYTHGCAVADYDNDGWPDLLVTGWSRLALFHNEAAAGGSRRFVEVTRRAGLDDTRWSTSAAWGDLDADGFPDLFVCQYVDWSFENHPRCKDYRGGTQRDVCPPHQFGPLPQLLYLNNQGGTFRDASQQAQLRPGKGLGVLILDVDEDGKQDVYVANDTLENHLYLNRGSGRFDEVGMTRGVAVDDQGKPNGSMGVDAADYDGSGHLSLFVTNYQQEAHALYRNRGHGQFLFASHTAGITALGLTFVGFGTGFLDFDRDGAEDLMIAHGHIVRYPPLPAEVRQLPVLLRNLRQPGDRPASVRFANVSAEAGPYFQGKWLGRGAALGDLDNDGRTDLVVSHLNEPLILLQNTLDNGHHWLGVELVGRPYRDAVGARVTLDVAGGTRLRAVKGGGSYLSANDRRILFGLGSVMQAGRLTVHWPSGQKQIYENLAVDRYWRILEGEKQAQPIIAGGAN